MGHLCTIFWHAFWHAILKIALALGIIMMANTSNGHPKELKHGMEDDGMVGWLFLASVYRRQNV